MPYSAITSRRIPYDIDGSVMSISNGGYDSAMSWVSSADLIKYNNNEGSVVWSATGSLTKSYWLWFTERKEIEAGIIAIQDQDNEGVMYELQGSNDTTNGLDGTWETAVFPSGSIFIPRGVSVSTFRSSIKPISFSTSYKVLRWRIYYGYTSAGTSYHKFNHFYGRKAAGETVDDVLFTDTNGDELTSLTDWGDRPEGTTLIKSFKVKNTSSSKIANNINLQLNHADFLISLDQVNWVATIDIASIPANSLSAEIFVKNSLGVPPLTLGPKAARVIATVGSFT